MINVAIEGISQAPHETHQHIDDALRSFLALTTLYKRMIVYPSDSELR